VVLPCQARNFPALALQNYGVSKHILSNPESGLRISDFFLCSEQVDVREKELAARGRLAKTPLILNLGRLAPITGESRCSGHILGFDQGP
jgi:hypothetical protein